MSVQLGEGPGKARFVSEMFSRIAGRYDLMNGLMTFGMHHAWRRAAARETIPAPDGPGLDLATGTGDLALELSEIHRHRTLVGADFAHGMLTIAGLKCRTEGTATRVRLVEADRSEEHTSELQSLRHLVCRLLLEKKKKDKP